MFLCFLCFQSFAPFVFLEQRGIQNLFALSDYCRANIIVIAHAEFVCAVPTVTREVPVGVIVEDVLNETKNIPPPFVQHVLRDVMRDAFEICAVNADLVREFVTFQRATDADSVDDVALWLLPRDLRQRPAVAELTTVHCHLLVERFAELKGGLMVERPDAVVVFDAEVNFAGVVNRDFKAVRWAVVE